MFMEREGVALKFCKKLQVAQAKKLKSTAVSKL